MLTVYNCIANEHDLRLVALAAAICALASWTAISLLHHVRRSQRTNPARLARSRSDVHRIRNLGHALHRHAGIFAGASERLQHRVDRAVPDRRNRRHRRRSRNRHGTEFGGRGGARGRRGRRRDRRDALHRNGGVRGSRGTSPGIADWWRVSIVLGVRSAPPRSRSDCIDDALKWKALGALLLTLAICSLHFTGMAAVSIVPDPTIEFSPAAIPSGWLAVAVRAGELHDHPPLPCRPGDRHARPPARGPRARADARSRQCRRRGAGDLRWRNDRHSQRQLCCAGGAAGRQYDRRLIRSIRARRRHAAEALGSPKSVVRGRLARRGRREDPGRAHPAPGRFRRHTSRRHRGPRPAGAQGGGAAHSLPRPSRRPDRARQSIELPQEARPGDRSPHWQRGGRSPSCASTSIDSRKSTISSATPKATVCCRRSPSELRACSTIARWWPGSAGTSSRSSSLAFPIRGSPAASPRTFCEVMQNGSESPKDDTLVSISIGIAICPDDAIDRQSLLSHADTALYRAKKEGRATYRFFEAAMGAEVRDRRLLELELRHAIARDELRLVYQPQKEIRVGQDHRFRGVAALEASDPGRDTPSCSFRLRKSAASSCRSESGCCARLARRQRAGPRT